MPAPDGARRPAAALPLLVLVGFPMLYFANAVSPWSRRFFVDADASYLVTVFGSIGALHWLTAFVAWRVLRADGLALRDAGLIANPRVGALLILLFLAAAAAVIAIRGRGSGRAALADPARRPTPGDAGVAAVLGLPVGDRRSL